LRRLVADSGTAHSAQLCSPFAGSPGTERRPTVHRGKETAIGRYVGGHHTIFAGNGSWVWTATGDATEAQIYYFRKSVAAEALVKRRYFADWARVRKIRQDGVITNGSGHGTGDDSPATTATVGPAIPRAPLGTTSVTVEAAERSISWMGSESESLGRWELITTRQDNNRADGVSRTRRWGPADQRLHLGLHGVAATRLATCSSRTRARSMVTTTGSSENMAAMASLDTRAMAAR